MPRVGCVELLLVTLCVVSENLIDGLSSGSSADFPGFLKHLSHPLARHCGAVVRALFFCSVPGRAHLSSGADL